MNRQMINFEQHIYNIRIIGLFQLYFIYQQMEIKYIQNQLKNVGYNQNAIITKDQIYEEINKIIKKQNNPNYTQFNKDTAAQIWQECQKINANQVYLRIYLNVFSLAKKALQNRLRQLQDKIERKAQERKFLEKNTAEARANRNEARRAQLNSKLEYLDKQIYQLQNDFRDYQNEYNNIMVAFGKRVNMNSRFSNLNKSNYANQNINHSFNAQNFNNSRFNNNFYQPVSEGNVDNSRKHSQIFFKRSDRTLIFLLVFSIMYFLIQLLLINHKFHFLNLLVSLGLIAIFGLNYFDKYYIRMLLVLITVSFVLDIIWLAVKSQSYWNPGKNTHDSSLNSGFLRAVVIMTGIVMVLKIFIFGILFSYKNIQQRTSLTICGYDINLSGQSDHNPISKLNPEYKNESPSI